MALEGALQQARSGFISMNYEHLDYLPPLGRWYDGRLVDCDDGETELELYGRALPQYVPIGPDPPNPLEVSGPLPLANPISVHDLQLRLELRNFGPTLQDELRETAPFPVREEQRWAALPPLEIALLVPVTWGAIKFAGAFCEELGRTTAASLVAWLKRIWDRAEDPARDRLFAVEFMLPDATSITAFVIMKHDDPESEAAALEAVEHLGEIASVAGLHKERETLAGLKRCAYIFSEGCWRLAWWTDGERILRTHWFDENLPDPSRFLVHPAVDLPDQSANQT